jgi:DNA-binding MarR family transcriptional regulator
MHHPKPDPTPDNESLGFLVRGAYRAFTRSLNAKLAQHNIPSSNWSALRALWRQDQCSQVDLAERLHVEKSSLSQVLVSLERKGLITLTRNPHDKRKTIVLLTPQGRRLKDEILPFADVVNKEATHGLQESDVIHMKRMLATIIQNLDPSTPP